MSEGTIGSGVSYPHRDGRVHPNIILRVLTPTMIAAGVSMIKKDRDGKVVHDDEGKPIHLPNTRACTRSGIFLRRGASTARLTAA